MKRFSVIVVALLLPTLAGCGIGGHSEREVATQKALDTNMPLSAAVMVGYQCPSTGFGFLPAVTKYAGIPGVHVGPTVMQNPPGYLVGHKEPCHLISWDAGIPIKKRDIPPLADVTIGHYVLDKLGEDQSEMGMVSAPFRAHFEPTELGKILVERGFAAEPQAQLQSNVMFAKDADGHVVAEIQRF
jgi:hypothetical protein